MKRFSLSLSVAMGVLLCMAVLCPSQTLATDTHAVNTKPQATTDTPQEQNKADETDEVIHALGAPPSATSDTAIEEQEEGEWRPLCKGQSMLYGAHVRLDMTTGERTIFVPKGKEMEYSDYANECPAEVEGAAGESMKGKVGVLPASSSAGKSQEQVQVEDGEAVVPAARTVTDVEQMDSIMRSLPEPEIELQSLDKSKLTTEEYDAAIRKLWTHRQAMIKKVMEGLQNDAKEMHKHLANLGDVNSTTADRVWNLEILEDLVGTVDNAQDFARMGGLDVCALLLSSSDIDADAEVKANAALLIGSASKYVEEVQVKANEIGLLGQLMGHMTMHTACGVTSSDPDADMLCSRLIYAVGSLVRGSSVNQIESKTLGLVNVLQQLTAKSPNFTVRAKALTLLGDLTLERYCPNAALDRQRMLLSEMLSEAQGGDEDSTDVTDIDSNASVCEASPLAMELADREHGQWFANQVRSLVDLETFPKPRLFAKIAKAVAHASSAYMDHNCDLKHHVGVVADAGEEGKQLKLLLGQLREAVAGLENNARTVDVTTEELRQALETVAVAFERVVKTDVWNGPSKCPVE